MIQDVVATNPSADSNEPPQGDEGLGTHVVLSFPLQQGSQQLSESGRDSHVCQFCLPLLISLGPLPPSEQLNVRTASLS